MRRALTAVAGLLLYAGCGKDSQGFSATDGGEAGAPPDNGTIDAASPAADGGVPLVDGGGNNGSTGCGPFNCRNGCCVNGGCFPGTAPAECGKGGLVCMNCAAVVLGCVNQGCGVATCTGCDGCCQAGTCNENGKTQDNQCGSGGAVCKNCQQNGQTCDGNGNCR